MMIFHLVYKSQNNELPPSQGTWVQSDSIKLVISLSNRENKLLELNSLWCKSIKFSYRC